MHVSDLINVNLLGSAMVMYMHYISIMLCFGALILERILLKIKLSKHDCLIIIASDIIYGITSLFVLISGILKVLYFGKESVFYIENPLFWWKVGLYLAMGGLSLYPTITYILWIIPLRKGQIPNISQSVIDRLRFIINTEVIILMVLPFLAILISCGMGL